MSSFQPNPSYRSPGMAWLEKLPAHWAENRLGVLVELRVSNVDKHSKQSELPVRLCNYVDVYKNDHIEPSMSFMRATASLEEIDRFRLEKHDVLLTKDSETWNDIGVPALVSNTAEDLISGYHLALLRPRKQMLGQYLAWALRSKPVSYQFHVAANGVTRYGLAHNAIRSVTIPTPPLDEQLAIVRYLDDADQRIRAYVSAKERLIALLEEERQAVIQHAVTRGIDPNVRLNPSGVEWLGDVPEHWEIRRARYLFREIDTRSSTGEEPHLSMSQRLGLVPSHLVEQSLISDSYAGGKLCEQGDLVLNRLKAHLGVFALSRQMGVISPDYSVFRKRTLVNMEYFEKVLKLPALRTELRIRSKGIVEGFWRLYTDDFFDIRLPTPPEHEQDLIIEHLERATSDIDSAIDRARRQIELMEEYRTRLIADVVTGEIDVRAKTPTQR